MVARAALDALRTSYKFWNKTKAQSSDKFLSLMADQLSMGSVAAGAKGMEFTRSRDSRKKAESYFAELGKDWTMIFFNVRDYVVQGSDVAMIGECSWRHNRSMQVVHTPKLDLWRFKGHQAVAFFDFFDTDQAIGACADCGPVLHAEPAPLYPANKPKVYEGLTDAARANVRKLKTFYKKYLATKGANYREGVELLAPSLEWMSLANGKSGAPFTVKRTTPAEVEDYFAGLYSELEMLDYDVPNVVAGGPYVIVHGSIKFRNKRTGKILATPKADCFRFARGKIVEFMEYYDTAGLARTVN